MRVALLLGVLSGLLASLAHAQEAPEAGPPATDDPNFWVEIYDPNQVAYDDAMRRAAAAAERGHNEAAFLAYQEAVEARPNAPDARFLAATYAQRSAHYDKAKEHLLVLRSIAPDADTNPEWHLCFFLGLAQTQLGEWRDAIASYETCSVFHPSWADVAQSNAAEVAMALGDLEQAEALYRGALKISPEHIGAMLGLSVALDRQGKRAEARSQLIAALYRDPALSLMFDPGTFFEPPGEVHYQLGVFYRELGRFADARAQFESYLEKADRGLYHDQAKERLEELEKATDPMVDRYPAPAFDTSAAVVDSKLEWLVVGTASGRLSAVRLKTGDVVEVSGEGPSVVDLAFTKGGKEVRALLADGSVLRLDPKKDMRSKGSWSGGANRAASTLTPDGVWVTSTTNDGFAVAKVGSKQSYEVPGMMAQPALAAVAPDRAWLAYFSHHDGLILELDGQTTVAQARSYGPREPILSIEPFPDSSGFVFGMPRAVIIHGNTTHIAKVLLPHQGSARSVALDPEGRYLTIVLESSIEVWRVDALELVP